MLRRFSYKIQRERVINLFYNGERTFSLVLMVQDLFIKREKWKYTNSRRKRVGTTQRYGGEKTYLKTCEQFNMQKSSIPRGKGISKKNRDIGNWCPPQWALIRSACHNTRPRAGQFQPNYFLRVPEAASPRSRLSLRPLFLACRWLPCYCTLMASSLCTCPDDRAWAAPCLFL